MRKLAKIIDFIVIRTIIFFVAFTWLVFYIKNTLTATLLAISTTIIVHLIISIFKGKIKRSKKLTKDDIKLKNQSINQMLLNEKQTNLDFFYKLILKINATTTRKNDNIYFRHNGEDFICFLHFSASGITKNDILKIYQEARKQKFSNIVVITNNYENTISSFVKTLKNSKIELISSDSIFSLMKKYNTFIEITDIKTEEKISFKQILKLAFNKKRFFPYLFAGFMLLFSSIFSPLKIYYLILSSIAFIFACISLFSKNSNIKDDKQNIFEYK